MNTKNTEIKSKFKGYCTSGAGWQYCYICNNNYCSHCNTDNDHNGHADHDKRYRI